MKKIIKLNGNKFKKSNYSNGLANYSSQEQIRHQTRNTYLAIEKEHEEMVPGPEEEKMVLGPYEESSHGLIGQSAKYVKTFSLLIH